MQRTPKEKYNVEQVFPLLFWVKCECCKNEFVREKGFTRHVGPFFGLRGGRNIYVCGKCAPTPKLASEWFDARDRRIKEMSRKIPPPPLAPPPRKP